MSLVKPKRSDVYRKKFKHLVLLLNVTLIWPEREQQVKVENVTKKLLYLMQTIYFKLCIM